mgnify:CR=1 FL=1
MGKNTLGGKKHKRAKNSNFDFKRPLQERQEGESYARVDKLLGGSRLLCECFDVQNGDFKITERVGTIRGSMRKRVWINIDDIILISLRGYQEDKCDIIWKYNADEIQELKSKKQLPIIKNDSIFTSENIEFTNIPSSINEEESDVEVEITNIETKNYGNDSYEDLDNI